MDQEHTSHTYGYTLVEMLVVVAIIGLLAPLLASTIGNLYSSHSQTLSRAVALTETTHGIKSVVRDVRAAVYAENGALPLVDIATSTLTLYADTDYDGDVERVRYFLDATTMRKGVIEPTSTSSYPVGTEVVEELTTGIINAETNTPLFRYYDATSTEITSTAQMLEVRRVEILLIGSAQLGPSSSEVTLQSSASIRNLKEAY